MAGVVGVEREVDAPERAEGGERLPRDVGAKQCDTRQPPRAEGQPVEGTLGHDGGRGPRPAYLLQAEQRRRQAQVEVARLPAIE